MRTAETAVRVLVADANPDTLEWLRSKLGDRYEVVTATSGAAARQALATQASRVLIVGDRLDDMTGAEFLVAMRERDGGGELSLFVADSGGGEPVETDDADAVFYVLKRTTEATHVAALLGSAVDGTPASVPASPLDTVEQAARLRRILEVARRLAVQRDLATAAKVFESAAIDLLQADRACCLFHDRSSGALWTESATDEGNIEVSAASGVAGYAARTNTQVRVGRAKDDPRYDKGVDDPAGTGDEHLMAQPIAGPDGEVHAVLIATRQHNRAPFADDVGALAASLAEQAGPLLHQLALQVEAQSLLDDAIARETGADVELFRREALEAHLSHRVHGDVVRISPVWVRWTYWLIVAVLVVGGAYLFIGEVDEYSSGPAVVRLSGRTDVTAKRAGIIASTEVRPGQRVTKGQLLARFYDAEESAELERLEQEFELQLVKFLRDPAEESVSRSLASLRAQKERAAARLEERLARAPTSGIVSDLRIRPGQALAPGDTIISLVSDNTDLSVIALMPGADRPQLRPGMTIRLELSGYRYAYQDLRIETVSDEVVGPTEARRFLGKQIGDSLQIRGAVVLVTMRLPSSTFTADGETYHFHDGMLGLAEARVRSERIITALIPGLKGL